jgi:hypothetical protein
VPDSCTNPKTEAIIVRLNAQDQATGLSLVSRLMQERPELAGWRVDPVVDDPRHDQFDLLPPSDEAAMPPGLAWEIAEHLRRQDGVADAEPSFVVDDYPEGASSQPPPTTTRGATGGVFDENDCDWVAKFVQADMQPDGTPGAWSLAPVGEVPGHGIRIAHPDSGYRGHAEIQDRLLLADAWDFFTNQSGAENDQGDHGLGTASVIVSPDNRVAKPNSVTGIAPGAGLIPLRVTIPHLPVVAPAPVLLCTGAKRLRDAILYAIKKRAHVISISLGWFGNESLAAAIRTAHRQDVIVVAAAGNYTGPIVVWPAAYPEVIALAGCDSRRRPWEHSARGRKVDFTGPAEHVWRADHSLRYVSTSDGTSHATAVTAGIAALWLHRHGREALLRQYREPHVPLADVFRHVLAATCDPPPVGDGRWGHGIVNARKCLEYPLPPTSLFRPDIPGGVARPTEANISILEEAFSDLTPSQLRNRAANVLGVRPENLANLAEQHAREVRFWLVTDPSARKMLAGTTPPTRTALAREMVRDRFSPGLQRAIERSP